MIDLSFLTAEEQEIILTVLKRDAELKKTEEQRVQNLQKTVNDRGQLRYLTGKWFYETKQLRHQDRIHGSDIIRASMRHTDKPISILELSQILPEKSSFVSSENKEVFVPPILCGLLLEPHRQLSHEGDENLNISTAPRDISALELQSPTKQRKNPFNSEPSDTCLFDRAVDQTKTQSQEPFPSSNSSISYASSVRQDPSNPVSQHPAVTMAMPEDIAVSTSLLDCSVEEEGSSSRESNSTALQGILKYLSTSNTTDSPFPHLNQQDPVSVDSPAETWIDRKQVSFSTMVSHNGKEWQDEKELGGCSLLDTDSVTSCEIKDSLLNNNDLENSGRRATGTYKLLLRIPNDLQEGELICKNDSDFRDQEAGQHQVHSGVSQQFHQELLSPAGSPLASAEQASGKPAHLEPQLEKDCQSHCKATDGPSRYNTHPPNLPKQSNDISIEATSDPKPSPSGSSNSSSHALLPQPRRKLLEIFRTGREEKSGRVQSCQKEEVKTQQRNQDNTHSISFSATDLTVDKNNAKPSELTEVRKLQLIAVQNTILTEAMITIDTDTQQEATESRDVQFPERLSNLKAFWERENTGPKIIFTREEARQEDISPKEIDISDGHQTYVEKINSLSAQKGHNRSQEDISWPQTECQPFVDLATEDGIYKANPVLIYDEKDYSLTGSLTESQIPEIPCQQVGVSVSAHIKSSVSTPEDRPAKIHDRKHFWESEYTGPRIISVRIREVSGSSVPCNKAVSPQSELKTSLYTKENEGEPQTSPHKPKSTVVLNSSILTDKGFFTESPESSCGTGDIKSTRHQFQVKPDTACEDRPLSLSKFQQLSSKDQANDVRRIPSKTCHPRVLPREPSSPERSRLESSPLKTFPIDIKPQTKAAGEHQGKPTPAPRQRKSPLHGANQTVLPDCKPSTNTTLCALPTSTLPSNSSSFTSPQPKKATEKKLENFTQLARSFIPQDFQYYLRPQEKVNNAPPFHQEKCIAEEIDMPHSPQISIRDLVGNLRDRLAEGNTPRISSWARQKKDENSKQDSTTRAWSLSWASPGSYDDSSSPVMSDVKCLSSRSMSSTKSLENVTSISRDDKTKNISTDQINLGRSSDIFLSGFFTSTISFSSLQLKADKKQCVFACSAAGQGKSQTNLTNYIRSCLFPSVSFAVLLFFLMFSDKQ
ncbi:uncharacterized protein sytl2a isoform X3 [Echeneis naucrates]|uniref:uncharacterized protein sytl2a isoform X3 n=1 Tax=Echeneis naucrates TaxID=173247 RepID=UPI00111459CC|nr:uncharacterized protein LOC115054620 isoform X3 [Echeneis naucrates]